MRFPIGHQL